MKTILLLLLVLVSAISTQAQSYKSAGDFRQIKNSTLMPASAELLIDNVTVYPNPVVDLLKVSFKSNRNSTAVISLFNNIGKQVLSQESLVETGNNLLTLDVRTKAVEPGIYFFQCVVENEVITRKRIIK